MQPNSSAPQGAARPPLRPTPVRPSGQFSWFPLPPGVASPAPDSPISAGEGLSQAGPMPLNVVTPTPADIDIAQAATPVPIAQIAERLGLGPDDYEPHGHLKAKIRLSVRDTHAEVQDGNYSERGRGADRQGGCWGVPGAPPPPVPLPPPATDMSRASPCCPPLLQLWLPASPPRPWVRARAPPPLACARRWELTWASA